MTETWLPQIPRICLFLSSVLGLAAEEDAVMNASPDQGLDCAAVATSLTGELSPAAVSMLTIYLLELPIVNALLAYANVHSAGQDSHHPKDVSPRGFV